MLPLFSPGAYWGQIQLHSMGQLIAGPLLMAVAATQGANWRGSVSCSRILRHVAQSRPRKPGIEPATF